MGEFSDRRKVSFIEVLLQGLPADYFALFTEHLFGTCCVLSTVVSAGHRMMSKSCRVL